MKPSHRRALALTVGIAAITDYYSISPGMLSQTPGKGAKYLVAFTDSTGTPLSGGASYRVTLPPNIPAANFWSVTLYEAENASGLANGQPFPSLGSRDKPAQNADGSTDLYLHRVLRYLQWQSGDADRRTWVLKSPLHAGNLIQLFDVLDRKSVV